MLHTSISPFRSVYGVPTLPLMGTGATDMPQLRPRGVQCYGVGAARDDEDVLKGFGAHSDQERMPEDPWLSTSSWTQLLVAKRQEFGVVARGSGFTLRALLTCGESGVFAVGVDLRNGGHGRRPFGEEQYLIFLFKK